MGGHPSFRQKPLLSREARAAVQAAGRETEDKATKELMAPQEPQEGEFGGGVKRRKAAVATDVSMELDILDCPVCYHPLRPPIFQCAVGHVVCSSCCTKLPDKCHSCCITTSYNRCHIIEHVVNSTKVSCLYGNLGCTAKIPYYEKEEHEKMCPHGPCFCPETNCSFSGSTSMLHEHFASVHMWHCIRLSYNKAFRFRVAQGSTILEGEDGHLFLVNMVLEPIGGVISLFSIQPNFTGSTFKCKLSVSCPEMSYSQVSQFPMRSTNLFDGLPKDCFLFVVPNVLLRDIITNATASVSVSVTLIPP
ncbi:unnamed protein product [Urochloa decumbens]|uniref:RING-type E3 ubiquitin transferase n=1 Tax=Urochloa decumbens TaxID=240449 RepID=A0ABC8Z0Q3_9POAL